MPLEFQTALPPPPPCLHNSSLRNPPPSPLEFQDATRGMVWIFSGITHDTSMGQTIYTYMI